MNGIYRVLWKGQMEVYYQYEEAPNFAGHLFPDLTSQKNIIMEMKNHKNFTSLNWLLYCEREGLEGLKGY